MKKKICNKIAIPELFWQRTFNDNGHSVMCFHPVMKGGFEHK